MHRTRSVLKASGVLALGLLALGFLGCHATRQAPPQNGNVAIVGATVVDVELGRGIADRTVLLDGDRIVGIGSRETTRLPAGTHIIDGTGQFLVPGLWDMHVHLGSRADARERFAVLLSHGITGVRDMGTPLEDALALRDGVERGEIIGPRIVTGGPLLNGPLPFSTPLILIVTPTNARHIVDSLKRRGADFLKVHDALPRETYLAIATAARERGISLVGHIPPTITARDAVLAGQRSVEHLGGRFYGVTLAVSSRETALHSRVTQILDSVRADLSAGRDPNDRDLFRWQLTKELTTTFDVPTERRLLTLFREKDVWHAPTLVAQPLRAALADSASGLTIEDRRWGDELLRLQARVVRDMEDAGVGLLAGTDLPLDPPQLVRELELLVTEAGLSPLAALRTATLGPARFLGRGDLGRIAIGARADLVLLRADPLQDIRALYQIATVIARGRVAWSSRR